MRSDAEAGRTLTRTIVRSSLQGWPLVDAMMQRQIEAGVTTVEDWTKHLEDEGLLESWLAWNADRSNPALQKIPAPLARPVTIDRWEVDAAWREAKAAFVALPKQTPWTQLYGFLLDLRIREPGTLLRGVGIHPWSDLAIAEATAGCTLLSNEEKTRITRGDDATLFGAIGRPEMTRAETDYRRSIPLIPDFVLENMKRYGHPDAPRSVTISDSPPEPDDKESNE